MPYYGALDTLDTATRRRTLARLLELRDKLAAEVPRRADGQLLLATWNIRDFDTAAYGERGLEPLLYIAEIISHFDLVAVTEVRADLRALHRLMELLGTARWDYLVTDVTGGSAGNEERLAIVYDTQSVSFGGLSGELVLPPIETTDEDGARVEQPAAQFARTPLLAGFRSRWLSLMLGVLHVRWGDGSSVPAGELRALIDSVTERDEDIAWARDLVLLGDFNIGSPDDTVWQALKDKGWVIPADFAEGIRGTNVAQDKFYDQIAVRPREGWFEFAPPGPDQPAAGVFNFFDVVYRPRADFETYRATMEAYKPGATRSNFRFDADGEPRDDESQRRWYRQYWRTHQMSDHLPLWVSLRTDYSDDYLSQKLEA